jgi:hypothetical protein
LLLHRQIIFQLVDDMIIRVYFYSLFVIIPFRSYVFVWLGIIVTNIVRIFLIFLPSILLDVWWVWPITFLFNYWDLNFFFFHSQLEQPSTRNMSVQNASTAFFELSKKSFLFNNIYNTTSFYELYIEVTHLWKTINCSSNFQDLFLAFKFWSFIVYNSF